MEQEKVLTLTGLTTYDGEIKKKIAADDATTLEAAKKYADGLGVQYDPAGTAQTKVDELKNGQVKTNTEAIAKLNGDVQVVGSVDQKISVAKTDLEGKIEASKYDDTVITGRVTANENALATLNGTGVGSVDKKVADAVAKIVSDAPEAYNTLKEISDWISSHETSASGMNSQIQANKSDIAKLTALVGTLPEGTAAKTIIEYIDSKVGGVDFSAQIETAKQEAISAASADATKKADKALEDAKTYSNGLANNYATAEQGTKADSALQKADIISGTGNGTISVKGEDVVVKGLGSAAYVATTSFDAAGTAQTKVNELANGAVKTNTTDISTLKSKVTALESDKVIPITSEEILALFN